MRTGYAGQPARTSLRPAKREPLVTGCAKGTFQIAHRKRSCALRDYCYVQFGTSLLHIWQPRGCNLGRPFCTSGNLAGAIWDVPFAHLMQGREVWRVASAAVLTCCGLRQAGPPLWSTGHMSFVDAQTSLRILAESRVRKPVCAPTEMMALVPWFAHPRSSDAGPGSLQWASAAVLTCCGVGGETASKRLGALFAKAHISGQRASQ